jgi:hypothetical protein
MALVLPAAFVFCLGCGDPVKDKAKDKPKVVVPEKKPDEVKPPEPPSVEKKTGEKEAPK